MRTHLVCQVGGPVQLGVVRDEVAALVGVAVDQRRHARQLGDEVERVLIHGVPVVELADARLVRRSELALWLHAWHARCRSQTPQLLAIEPPCTLFRQPCGEVSQARGKQGACLQGEDSSGELCHWMRVGRQRLQHFVHVRRDVLAALGQLRGQGVHLLLAGHLQRCIRLLHGRRAQDRAAPWNNLRKLGTTLQGTHANACRETTHIAGEQQPEQALGKRLAAGLRSG